MLVQASFTHVYLWFRFTLAALPSKKSFSSRCAAQRDLLEVGTPTMVNKIFQAENNRLVRGVSAICFKQGLIGERQEIAANPRPFDRESKRYFCVSRGNAELLPQQCI